MQSLNLRVISDFNTGTARSWPGRVVVVVGGGGGGGGGVTDLETAATRRQCLSYRYNGKNFRIAACSAERSGGGGVESQSSFLARSQSYALLKQQMEVAAKSEDYKEAARIRDSLRLFEEEEPVLRLRRLIKNAVAEEKFEEAARYRDELKEIAPHSLLQCSSDATTLIVVTSHMTSYLFFHEKS